jgi:hypothetical protein
MIAFFKHRLSLNVSFKLKLGVEGKFDYIIPFAFMLAFALGGVGYAIYLQADKVTPVGAITSISGQCLTNLGGVVKNNNPIITAPCVLYRSQIWTIASNNSLEVQGYCLDASKSGTTIGTEVNLYQCDNSPAQEWSLTSAHVLVNTNSSLCLGIAHKFSVYATNLDLQSCTRSPGQLWQLPTGDNPNAARPNSPQKNPAAPAQKTSPILPILVNHQLVSGSTASKLKLRGITVWGIEDSSTQSFGVSEYANRQTIVNTIKSWGGNVVRLRVQASDYNDQTYMSKLQYLQEIKDWQTATQAAGLYLQVTWWDSLNGIYSGANWSYEYPQVFPMMTAVINELGAKNPYVLYEPFDEPNNIAESQWLGVMEATQQQFRADGYTGVLILDTDDYSHQYNDADMTAIENNDARLSGMDGKSQICFAKQDYATDYANPNLWTESAWTDNDDGSSPWNFSAHCVIETEFGNYNESPSSVHSGWSASAAAGMASKINSGQLQGAEAFLFGPWTDANALTTSNNVTPTQWGTYVENNFLKAIP